MWRHIQSNVCIYDDTHRHWIIFKVSFPCTTILVLKWDWSCSRKGDKEERGLMQQGDVEGRQAQGHMESWEETMFVSVTIWGTGAQEPQHRWRFDSVVCSLSPPTFTRCETTSRFYPGSLCTLCFENSTLSLPQCEHYWMYMLPWFETFVWKAKWGYCIRIQHRFLFFFHIMLALSRLSFHIFF